MSRDLRLIDRVRAAAKDLHQAYDGVPFDLGNLADRLGVQTFADKEKLRRRQVAALVKSGELLRVQPGQYRWRGKTAVNQKEIMWRVLRARRLVSADDLMELAGAAAPYVQEFLRRLLKQGVVQKLVAPRGENWPDKFRLVDDPGPEMPKDETKAAYLRRRREQIKAALTALDAVFTAVAEARMAVSELEEG